MTALVALIRKDLILYLSNRRALLINLLMPIGLAAFMGFLFGGSGEQAPSKISVALVAQDSSAVGKKIAAGLKADGSLTIVELPLDQAQDQVRHGKLNAAIVIPAGFGEAAGAALFGAGSKPELPVYYDPSQATTLALVKGLLTQQVMQVVSAEMFSGQGGRELTDKSLQALEARAGSDPESKQLAQFLSSLKTYQGARQKSAGADDGAAPKAGGGLSMPFATRDEALTSGKKKYNGYAHSFAGMSVQFILFFGIDVAIALLLARKLGIWSRLLAAPVSLRTILLARALSCAIISFCLVCAIFLVAALFFQVKITGSLIGFLGVAACFSLMTSCFGLLIAAFGKTPEAARGIAIFATLIMVMLGGAWVPTFIFPQWLQSATLVMPTRWAVDGFDAMTWRGLELSVAGTAMAVQLGFALVFGALAFWRFAREAD